MRLVLDFDGTVTERDTLDLVLERFGDAAIYERVEHELDAGRMTLNEVIAAEFQTVTAPLDEVVGWLLENARIRPGFAELAREGVLEAVELRANRVDPRPDGWVVDFRVGDACGACGEPCKRADLPDGEVVYAGDGHSDYCAALAADRVFATGSLARWLRERGVAFTPLTDFRALASEL